MNSGISYPIILVSTALCVKAKATIIGRYINSSIHYVWLSNISFNYRYALQPSDKLFRVALKVF